MGNVGTGQEFEGAVKPSSVEWDSYEKDLFAARVTDIPSNMKKRLDYDVRSDDNPVYVGFAPKGMAEGTDGWLLYKLTYDGSDRVTEVNVYYGNWTDRAGYTYE